MKITIEDIFESLENLDTEYRESLANALMKLNYTYTSPLELSLGDDEDNKVLDTIYNMPLKQEQIKEIISFISDEMKEDYQYGAFKRFETYYMNMANSLDKINPEKQVEILNVWESDFDDIRCNALLYQNGKKVGNIIASFNDEYLSRLTDKVSKNVFEEMIIENFNKYISLPKISDTSPLLREIYDNVCESDSSMCYITDDDWNEYYADKYSEEDIEKLKSEVKKYKLDSIITFDEEDCKIDGYGGLAISFNDDRSKDVTYER